MKRSRFSEEQIIGILREQEVGDGGGVPQATGVKYGGAPILMVDATCTLVSNDDTSIE